MSLPAAREVIWSRFFALMYPALTIPGGGPFRTVSRRARHYSNVPSGEQPALFLMQRHETSAEPSRGIPSIYHMRGEIYVYARNELNQAGQDSGGGQVLNPLLDAIELALFPIPAQGNVQTLGGLVSRAYIDGDIEIDEGNIDKQSVAIIPVSIIAPV